MSKVLITVTGTDVKDMPLGELRGKGMLGERIIFVNDKHICEHMFPPEVKTLMRIFRIFDKHGLIRDDLCFDPEHFMETVVREHWNDEE